MIICLLANKLPMCDLLTTLEYNFVFLIKFYTLFFITFFKTPINYRNFEIHANSKRIHLNGSGEYGLRGTGFKYISFCSFVRKGTFAFFAYVEVSLFVVFCFLISLFCYYYIFVGLKKYY